jgi:hypothetical protein
MLDDVARVALIATYEVFWDWLRFMLFTLPRRKNRSRDTGI